MAQAKQYLSDRLVVPRKISEAYLGDSMNYLYSYNYKRARQNGAKFSPVGWLINLIDPNTHSEIRFSDAFKRVSFSCTNADKARCCRFKMIEYSHGMQYWDIDPLPVDYATELSRILEACRQADVTISQLEKWLATAKAGDILYGKNAIKYDQIGTALSFVSRLNLIRSSKTKSRCCEAVARVIQRTDLLDLDPELATPGDLRRAVRNRWPMRVSA